MLVLDRNTKSVFHDIMKYTLQTTAITLAEIF